MPEHFREYVARNYPSRTIISNPDFHAPKLWRAALCALRAAQPEPSQPVGDDGWRRDAEVIARRHGWADTHPNSLMAFFENKCIVAMNYESIIMNDRPASDQPQPVGGLVTDAMVEAFRAATREYGHHPDGWSYGESVAVGLRAALDARPQPVGEVGEVILRAEHLSVRTALAYLQTVAQGCGSDIEDARVCALDVGRAYVRDVAGTGGLGDALPMPQSPREEVLDRINAGTGTSTPEQFAAWIEARRAEGPSLPCAQAGCRRAGVLLHQLAQLRYCATCSQSALQSVTSGDAWCEGCGGTGSIRVSHAVAVDDAYEEPEPCPECRVSATRPEGDRLGLITTVGAGIVDVPDDRFTFTAAAVREIIANVRRADAASKIGDADCDALNLALFDARRQYERGHGTIDGYRDTYRTLIRAALARGASA
ncbi:MAG: hypothetical protein V4617_15240 [Gemmatimonadota bacterium]